MVTDAGLLVPVYDPLPEPAHEENTKSVFGVAVIDTEDPDARNPEEGVTEPPGPAFMVSWYCVWKFAVYVVDVAGVTV
jgi:hypothetical protein